MLSPTGKESFKIYCDLFKVLEESQQAANRTHAPCLLAESKPSGQKLMLTALRERLMALNPQQSALKPQNNKE